MRAMRQWTRLAPCAALCGVTFAGGCLANLQGAVDLVLSPAASGNIAVVSRSALAPLARFFSQLFFLGF
ncbi:MAG: hypothetical protein D6744_02315 [Planctomycetota bacterium]|nr:MAG: hypothetical protein D6744_02315 [Planctomycetota bacterium]